jgi:hypothetical protein
MNDQLEYKNGYKPIWDKLYFASFIVNKRENIGMWSIYAQPWKDGIKISIPISSFLKLLDSTMSLRVVNKDESLSKIYENKDEHLGIYMSAVAYTNCDSKESKDEGEVLNWNTVKNKNFDKVSKNHELTGYIKDAAWSYEQEIRLKALFDKPKNYHRLAINIESILNDMILVTGPLFEGSLGQRLLSDTKDYDGNSFKIDSSIFQNRFILKSFVN